MAKVTLNDLSKALGLNEKEPKKDFHYYGTIVSSNPEDRTYEVSINRDQNISVEAARLVGAAVGDTVMVTVMANGYATVTGRLGGDLDATDAQRAADNAADVASSAMGTANSALSNAQQANQAATAARTLAEHAEEEAGRAHTAAEQAASDASSAASSASAAATSAQNAASSASSAEADASRASTAATNAEANAATAAASASSAQADAATAASSASSAQADASRAATSASNAESSATSAQNSASQAATSASNAASDASAAHTAASEAKVDAAQAKTDAATAKTAATEAKADASSAKADASRANIYANAALNQLAVVEDVTGTLDWIVSHGTYNRTTDQTVQEGKVYFTYNSTTQDYAPVIDPKDSEISTYYELDITDSQSEFVMSHLAVTQRGLWVLPSGMGNANDPQNAPNYKTLLASDGMWIYDGSGVMVAHYGNGISFDSTREFRIGDQNAYVRFVDSNNDGVADRIEIKANSISLGSSDLASKISEIEGSISSTDQDLTNYITSNEQALEDLQNQIDGAIDTWYYSGDPTLSNQPAVAWTTDETKENHLRDLYFNTQNGHSFRFAKEGNTYKWIQIQDADAIKALADAAAAQGTANVKKRVFVAQPTPPYDIGDLWVQGSTGDIKRCATAKTSSQSFAAADWVLASKYTDDTKANAVETDLHTNYYVKSDFSVEPDKIASTISATETTVKTYADNKASTAESNAKTYADNNFDGKGSAASALNDAKDYADDNFDSKGSASAAQAAAISAAAADATSKANAAESNAKADTTNKLKSYYTKTQTDSAITQKADNILSTVSTTYQTKADMDDYSTTAEMNSAIDQKADSITSTVSQTYATKTQAQGYANTAESNAKTAAATDATNKANAAKADAISTASTDATNKANAAKADAISTASTDATNKANAAKQAAIDDAATKYYTKTQTYTKSEIEQKAGEISLSVAQEEVEKVISVKEASGNIVHVEDASEYPALSLKVNITPKQSGTGTPSPDNVRPISGWSSVSVTDAGKNLLKVDSVNTIGRGITQTLNEDGTITLSGTTTSVANVQAINGSTFIKLPTGTYRFVDVGQTSGTPFYYYLRVSGNSAWIRSGETFTVPEGSSGCWIVLYSPTSTTVSGTHGLMIVSENSTYDTYEPYTGTTTTIPLGRTVYGGPVDIVSGVLGDNMKHDQMTYSYLSGLGSGYIGFSSNVTQVGGNAVWVRNWNYTDYPENIDGGIKAVCNAFPISMHNKNIINSQYRTWFGVGSMTSVAEFLSAVQTLEANGNGLWIAHEIKTPTTYQLTPTEVNTLLGENNVWADVGDIYLKYASMNSDMHDLMSKSNADLKITADGISSEVSKKVGNDEVISKINQSAESVKIQASKVEIDGTAIFNAISDDVEDTIEGYGYQTASQVSTAVTNGVSGKADKTAAVAEEQYIYISKASGTTSVTGTTTWVTAASDSQNTWTTKRPTYSSSYPVLFVAKQKKTVSGTVTCTTPVKDDTTTIIDGGHITTGTIDATKVTVTNLNADNITGGTLNIARVPDDALNSNVNVGGRNLVPNSKYVAPDSNTGYVWGRNKQYATVIPGETYTLSLYYNGERMTTVDHGYAYAYAIKSDGTKISGDYMHSSNRRTRVMDQDVVQLEVYPGLRNYVVGDVYCVKLEKGNKATDWTPAPEDVASDIEDASKVADNYLKFEPNKGLMVADQTNGIQTIDATTQRNVLIDSDSVDIRNGQNVLGKFGLYTTVDDQGTTSYKNGVQIGKQDESHMDLDYHSMQLKDKGKRTYFYVSDLRDVDGYAAARARFRGNGERTIFETPVAINTDATRLCTVTVDHVVQTDPSDYTVTGGGEPSFIEFTTAPVDGADIVLDYWTRDYEAKAYTLGIRKEGSIVGLMSVAEGYGATASGFRSHAEGSRVTSSGDSSHAEGAVTQALGEASHAEGYVTTASGHSSHAEGYETEATMDGTHAEGYQTTASGHSSHAEGHTTIASGDFSHAEGFATTASGRSSHTGGIYTVAGYSYQTVIGKYNSNKSNTAFEIGNGSDTFDNKRSNALTVDWDGNLWTAGHYTSAITACGAAGTTELALSTSEQKVNLNSNRARVGADLTNNNGGVKCAKSGYVEVSGNIYFLTGFNANDYVHLVIKRGSTTIINAVHRIPNDYDYFSVAPIVYSVSAGDILYLYAYNQSGARGKINAATGSWLTVKYL